MEVKHTQDLDGSLYREYISDNYKILEELKKELGARDMKVWMNPYNDKRWVLTVQIIKGK